MTDRFANRMDVAALTDVGRKRQLNEDSYRVDSELGLLLVADGMGGHDAGEVASGMAVETVADFLFEYDPDDLPEDGESPSAQLPAEHRTELRAVKAAVESANRRINSENMRKGYREGSGMGTTVVGLFILDSGSAAAVFHVGDSRLYRVRGGQLSQVTRDHTLYQNWLDQGGVGEAPKKNIILRALGPWEQVDVELQVQSLERGDLYLVCSDGLSSLVGDDVIARGLAPAANGGDLQEACRTLVDSANAAGGADNITVVLGRCR